MAIRRDSSRQKLLPARSIEETGLDASLYGAFLSPCGALSPIMESSSTPAMSKLASESLPVRGRQIPPPRMPLCSKCQHEETSNSDNMHLERNKDLLSTRDQQNARKRASSNTGTHPKLSLFKEGRQVAFSHQEENEESVSRAGFSCKGYGKPSLAEGSMVPGGVTRKEDIVCRPPQSTKWNLVPASNELYTDGEDKSHAKLKTASERAAFSLTKNQPQEFVSSSVDDFDQTLCTNKKNFVVDPLVDNESTHQHLSFVPVSPGVPQTQTLKVVERSQALDTSPSGPSTLESFEEISDSTPLLQSKRAAASGIDVFFSKESLPSTASSKADARSRWKRAAHSVKFINRLAVNIRLASTDLIEDKAVDEMMQQHVTQDDAGGVGAAAFEGARTVARLRSRGRKGMEGLVVQQDRGFISFLQDFYVACLKMPIGHFLIGVFLAPLVLGLVFTPLYLVDVDGLSFNGIVPEDATTSPFVSARQRFLAFLNIFLYALSLSTTFGGAPVAAESPFCLLVANMNTLMAQFLFVFLSGAVFARMSQPSYPIRCSKKAIIKTDDLLPVLGLEKQENMKVFAVRLVLTGPPPCELVDAKICLTFRIFVTLPSGSVFCSTQDLEVVRSEVSYLRYGLMVRHIIDKKSPVYGHTMETLNQGDASFSLTIMGLERTSMQPVFHLEDYFVCDNDVIWEGDYEDFIRLDKRGQRVLDHSRIDVLKPVKAAARASQAVSRMKHLADQKLAKKETTREFEANDELKQELKHAVWPRKWFDLHKRKLAKTMSTSFTRADW